MASWEQVATTLVAERGDALTRYAYLLTGNADDASDLVQDSLVRTFSRLRGGFTLVSAEAYVRRAILNGYLDLGRRRTRWRERAHLAASDSVELAASDATDVSIDIAAELGKLSPRERSCIVLRYYEDLKVDDIAEWLGISPGAVKRYLSDGLGRLRTALDDRTTHVP